MFLRKLKFLFGCIAFVVLLCGSFSCGNGESPERADFSSRLPFPAVHASVTDTAYVNGYFFIAPFRMTKGSTRDVGSILIVDGNGAIVWVKAYQESSNFQMHEGGTMSYFARKQYFIMNENFEVIDSIHCVNGSEADAHEFMILPRKNRYLVMGTHKITEDHSDFTMNEPIHWQGGKEMRVMYNVIQELEKEPGSELTGFIYEWTSKTAFRIQDNDPVFLTDTFKTDIPHLNAFTIDDKGNFLVTARYTNEVVYCDRTTGDAIWRLGGPRSDFTITGYPYRNFIGQHAAHVLPNGNILLFDNGYALGDKMHAATAVEFKLDTATKTAQTVWSYTYDKNLVSEATGNAQRLENGATLVSFGKILNCTHNVLCVVVDANNKIRLQLEMPDTMATYRTYYYKEVPLRFNRPKMEVEARDTSYVFRTGDGAKHLWSTGQTAAAIEVTTPGVYQWFRMNADSSYTGSDSYRITREMLIKRTEN